MPLYEYHCQFCGEEFEKMMRMSEADQKPECPHCQSSDTHKKISVFAARGLNTTFSPSSASSGNACSPSSPFR